MACAVFSWSWAAVGSSLAIIWPLATWSPILTSISVTVPVVAKSTLAVLALCTVPVAETVATTFPVVAETIREPFAELAGVALETHTVWYAQNAPASASTPRPVFTKRLGRLTTPPARLRPGRI